MLHCQLQLNLWLLHLVRYCPLSFSPPSSKCTFGHFDKLLSWHQIVFNELCGRSGQKVAVVMPFIERQVPDLKQNVQTWAKFFPCSSSFVRPRPFMKLFFFFNNAHNKTLEQELLENWNVSSQVSFLPFQHSFSLSLFINCFRFVTDNMLTIIVYRASKTLSTMMGMEQSHYMNALKVCVKCCSSVLSCSTCQIPTCSLSIHQL